MTTADSWGIQDDSPVEEWNPLELHTRATNGNERTKRRIPADFHLTFELNAQIEEFLANPQCPYSSFGAFLRDAIVHRAHFWGEELGNDRLLGALRMDRYKQRRAFAQEWREEFDAMRREAIIEVANIRAEKDYPRALQALQYAKEGFVMDYRCAEDWQTIVAMYEELADELAPQAPDTIEGWA